MPKISVVIPTYNRGEFISETIQSVLQQTYKDYEIIVVDDGSTDNTKEAVSKFGDKVRYIYQTNRGPSAARNTGIKQAKGKYIAFLDSDDRYLPDKLKEQMKFIKKNPKCKFMYTWYYNVQNGKRTKLRKPMSCKSREHLQYALFTRKFTIRTSTVLIRRSCFEKVGYFNEDYWYSQDWDMWLRLAAECRGYCLENPLCEYWLHDKNRSSLSVKTYHPKIIESVKKLYNWNEKKVKELARKYEDPKRNRRKSK